MNTTVDCIGTSTREACKMLLVPKCLGVNCPFRKTNAQAAHEPILFGWKKAGKHEWYSDRKQSTIWEFDKPKKSDLHPTMACDRSFFDLVVFLEDHKAVYIRFILTGEA